MFDLVKLLKVPYFTFFFIFLLIPVLRDLKCKVKKKKKVFRKDGKNCLWMSACIFHVLFGMCIYKMSKKTFHEEVT